MLRLCLPVASFKKATSFISEELLLPEKPIDSMSIAYNYGILLSPTLEVKEEGEDFGFDSEFE